MADEYQVNLRRRSWVPEARLDIAGIRAGCAASRVHFLLQFKQIPDSAQRDAISAAGVLFHGYVHGKAYIVSMAAADLEALALLDNVRAAFPLEPELKIDEKVRSSGVPPQARRPDGRMVLNVQFHDDVEAGQARAHAERLGGEVLGQSSLIHLVTAAFPPDAVDRIAAEDSVQYVDFVEPPLTAKPPATKG
jgi:hypothetical protein